METLTYLEKTCNTKDIVEITFDNIYSARRKICPFEKENSLKTDYNIKRENITTNRNGFVIKSENVEQSNKITKLQTIAGVSCKVREHDIYNQSI